MDTRDPTTTEGPLHRVAGLQGGRAEPAASLAPAGHPGVAVAPYRLLARGQKAPSPRTRRPAAEPRRSRLRLCTGFAGPGGWPSTRHRSRLRSPAPRTRYPRPMRWAVGMAIAWGLAGCGGSSPGPELSRSPRVVLAATTTPPPGVSATVPPTPTGSAARPTAASSAAGAPQPAKVSKLDMMGIWGSDAKHIWVVGEKGTILQGDGATWVQVASDTTAKLRSVTGTDASHAWLPASTRSLRGRGRPGTP